MHGFYAERNDYDITKEKQTTYPQLSYCTVNWADYYIEIRIDRYSYFQLGALQIARHLTDAISYHQFVHLNSENTNLNNRLIRVGKYKAG